nr:biotin--[acetyl-CoA-carboxylase] ligase [Pseudodesulfovibrio cashew]
MEAARLLYEQGAVGEWGSVVALTQTGGRGQLRRPWSSPPGNLFASVVLPKAPTESEWSTAYGKLLPLLCGYMIAEILGEQGAQLEVKWPNDLLQNDRKVGGMLIESKKEVDILGLGINLIESPSDSLMREDRSVPAGIMQTGRGVPTTVGMWHTLVNRWKKMYIVLLGELKPPQFVSAMLPRLAWLGRRILVHEREGLSFQAEIIGISPEGGLVVRRPEGEGVLFSGSIIPL